LVLAPGADDGAMRTMPAACACASSCVLIMPAKVAPRCIDASRACVLPSATSE
jgi:hypothetical protein